MATLTLLRHGRTVANAGGLLQGRADNPLDATGRTQAAAAAAAIGDVDRIVSSPLLRAQQTAEAFGADVEIDERWIELDYGDWDGRPVSHLPPGAWERWRQDLSVRPPNGETLLELGHRVRDALEELASSDEGNVLVVSHVSPIKAAVAWALGVDDTVTWRTHLTTGSYSSIRIGGDVPVLTAFNVVP
jgi:probable phosphoglycerate mutase